KHDIAAIHELLRQPDASGLRGEPSAADAPDDAFAVGLLLRREDIHCHREAVLVAVNDVFGSGVVLLRKRGSCQRQRRECREQTASEHGEVPNGLSEPKPTGLRDKSRSSIARYATTQCGTSRLVAEHGFHSGFFGESFLSSFFLMFRNGFGGRSTFFT